MAAPSGGHRELGAEFGFDAFGVPCALGVVPAGLAGRVEAVLPPGVQRRPSRAGDLRISLRARAGGYRIEVGGAQTDAADIEAAIGDLDARIRAEIARRAPSHVFIHAAAVAVGGRAIVMPAPSLSGKTRLTLALLERGATYLSDEFAVLDSHGLVHPYAKPLSVRSDGALEASELPAEILGVATGTAPVPVGLVVVTSHRPGATWGPRKGTPGEGALALLANAVPGRERPKQALAAAAAAVAHAGVLIGDRGEATPAARSMLGRLEDARAAEPPTAATATAARR